MLHGNISNKSAPIIAFNVDNLLFREPKEGELTLKEKLLNKFVNMSNNHKSIYFNRPLNEVFVAQLSYLWHKHNVAVYLVTFFPDYHDDLVDLLLKENVPFSRIEGVEEWEELSKLVRLRYMYYFDTDLELVSYLSSNNAMSFYDLPKVLK